MQVHKRLTTDAPSDIILTLIVPYIMYYIAEETHCSGVLAVVSGGLFMASNQLNFLSSSSRLKGFNFWESFVFLLNGLVFFIIGLGLPEIVAGIKSNGIPIETAIAYGVIVTIVLIVARIISSYVAMFSTIVFRPHVARNMNFNRRSLLSPLVLGWTGMRGVVSLAAALSIPLQLNGAPFPYRNLILFVTFVVILLTLVIQGLTLPYIINKYKPFLGLEQLEKEKGDAEMHLQIKKDLKQHVYLHIKEKYERDWIGHTGMERVLKHWEDQVNSQDIRWIDDNIKIVLLEMFEIQRDYLKELNKNPEINEELIRQQIHQIDLEEERIRYV